MVWWIPVGAVFLVAASLGIPKVRSWVRTGYRRGRRRLRGLPLLAAVCIAVAGGFAIAAAAAWILQKRIHTNSALAAPIDITKLSFTVAGGVGAAVALVVAYRRQRDIEQGRFVERFGAAAAQLGDHDVAVRIAGVYAMAGVADESTGLRRQQCIDVLCGYLRLPYSPELGSSHQSKLVLTEPRTADDGSPLEGGHQERHLEYRQNDKEVRATIVRVIADHLRDHEYNWSGCDFDFRTAHLEDVDFARALFGGATRFDAATFFGPAVFDRATFSGHARFDRATFSGDARFDDATFSGPTTTWFNEVTFSGRALFNRATFSGHARFDEATFSRPAWFSKATFSAYASFDEATFSGAWFEEATFAGDARFSKATFSGPTTNWFNTFFGPTNTWFDKATFSGYAWFDEATFSGRTWFGEATFSGPTMFNDATFSGDASFNKATFSGPAGFEGAYFGSRAITFEYPRQWGPPEPTFDWDGDLSKKPANVTPQSWPPTTKG